MFLITRSFAGKAIRRQGRQPSKITRAAFFIYPLERNDASRLTALPAIYLTPFFPVPAYILPLPCLKFLFPCY